MAEVEPDRNARPPYSYVPGGPWPHPISDLAGHSHGHREGPVPPIVGDAWRDSPTFLRGVDLFDHGFYWEAHEAWEALWHAHGRRGPVADVLKALIKLAAAGVKVREGQSHGVSTHASRAAALFRSARREVGRTCLGLDLDRWATIADEVARCEPTDAGARDAPASVVFDFRLGDRPDDQATETGTNF